jgi:hypothetical protein
MRMAIRSVLGAAGLLASLAAIPPPAAAWGSEGHQAVGYVAERFLTAAALAEVRSLVAPAGLQQVASWADEIRLQRRNTAAWHFVDTEITAAGYAAAVDCKQGDCAIAAIDRHAARMADRSLPLTERQEALKFVVHFVGDLHQPLHVGAIYLDDAGKQLDPTTDQEAQAHKNSGGNTLLLQGHKLHSLWDDLPGPLTTRLLAGAGAADARQVQPSSGPVAQWPAQWATDTLRVAPQAFQGLQFGAKIDTAWPATSSEPAYRLARENLQRAQLAKAGARLAQLLTTLFP